MKLCTTVFNTWKQKVCIYFFALDHTCLQFCAWPSFQWSNLEYSIIYNCVCAGNVCNGIIFSPSIYILSLSLSLSLSRSLSISLSFYLYISIYLSHCLKVSYSLSFSHFLSPSLSLSCLFDACIFTFRIPIHRLNNRMTEIIIKELILRLAFFSVRLKNWIN